VNSYATHDGRGKKAAKQAVLDLFQKGVLSVAYDRELRYRLESEFPHDSIGEAIRQLKESGELKPTNVPGRRGSGDVPNIFYRLPGSNYEQLVPIMHRKLDLSIFIAGVAPEMGRHAELAWWRAFKRNGWNVYPSTETEFQGVKEYKGRQPSTGHDIDFIAEKDGIEYGVEIKNGLNYPDDLYWKFTVAVELGTIPLIIARWLNPAQIPLIEELGGAKPIVYRDALYSKTYEPIILEARNLLGVRILPMDEVDDSYFTSKMQSIHAEVLTQHAAKKAKLGEYASHIRWNLIIRRTLGDKTR